ncbi:MAG TPA: hypothetical protein VLS89_08090 [Candidatus Nanopelagicales bacterium]|nr:hypothetical protein [Candidatus Nanopelagicales bacterium]
MDGSRRSSHIKLVQSSHGVVPNRPARRPGEQPSHLQVVLPPSESDGVSQERRESRQLALFPVFSSSLLGILNIERVSGIRFEELLRDIRPRWLFDLRPVPRFDIDQLNRRRAFALFRQYRVEYLDITGRLDITSGKDASLSSGRIADEVTKELTEIGTKSAPGPLVFLVDDEEIARISTVVLPERLRPQPKGGWDTQILR